MKKYFVIGNPIDHSLSPKLHNYWLKENKIDAIYHKKKINQKDLQTTILEIKEKKTGGINVTVPFKKSVIPYLDKLSPEAEQTQSVNTIILNDNILVGHNTDISGFTKAIKDLSFNIEGKKIFILGAGGVVPSIIFALNKMNVSEIIISNRTRQKADDLKSQFKIINVIDWGNIPKFDMIINATSLGLNNEALNLNFSEVGDNKLFYDVIYNPSETSFLKEGKKLGNQSENGKLMFIYQALEAFKIWHGIEPEINTDILKLLEND
ncbi:shikimate dehydrogenase [Candidatus Pelagibacter sp. HIMB123]|uniref:shikimate dehydrogenase n=1 Tax=Candidatus Pelagibacter sp. HIMB123 TaxID=3415413 RepID=UPI003F842DDB